MGAFLEGRISFPSIAHVVEESLSRIPWSEPDSIDAILVADANARRVAQEVITSRETEFAPAGSAAQTQLAAF